MLRILLAGLVVVDGVYGGGIAAWLLGLALLLAGNDGGLRAAGLAGLVTPLGHLVGLVLGVYVAVRVVASPQGEAGFRWHSSPSWPSLANAVKPLILTAIVLASGVAGLFLGGLLGYGVGRWVDPSAFTPHGGGLICMMITALAAMMGIAAGIAGAIILIIRRNSRPGGLRSRSETTPVAGRLAPPPQVNDGGMAASAASLGPIPLASLSPTSEGIPRMLAQLVVVAGPDKGRSFPLEDGQTLQIGRGQETSTQLNDPRISRKQCVLEIDGGKFMLSDLGGSGGTLVNGAKIARHELQPGDTIRIGETELRLELDALRDQSTLAGPALSRPKPAPAVAPLKDLVGTSLQHFEIKMVLATGTTGMVFQGIDTQQNRPAAIKVLWPESTQKEDELQRFIRAMKTMMNIQHENLVQIYAAGKTGPYCWVAMEYVDGESLNQVIHRIGTAGKLDWRNAFRVAVHMARALEKAFEHQIIHRNITPANILVRHSDKVSKLGDLMLA